MPLKDIKGMEVAVIGVNEIRDDHEYAPVKISALTGVAATTAVGNESAFNLDGWGRDTWGSQVWGGTDDARAGSRQFRGGFRPFFV